VFKQLQRISLEPVPFAVTSVIHSRSEMTIFFRYRRVVSSLGRYSAPPPEFSIRGIKVTNIKLDPYMQRRSGDDESVPAGEVFVTRRRRTTWTWPLRALQFARMRRATIHHRPDLRVVIKKERRAIPGARCSDPLPTNQDFHRQGAEGAEVAIVEIAHRSAT